MNKFLLSIFLILFACQTYAQITALAPSENVPEDPFYFSYFRTEMKHRSLSRELEDLKKIAPSRNLELLTWPADGLSFPPGGVSVYAGDINRDGLDDHIRAYQNVAELDTEELSDLTNQTLIFYGSNNLEATPDTVIESYLRPAGDLNGDGFHDALGLEADGSIYIYTGSENGYERKDVVNFTFNSFINDLIYAGYDYNNDGYQDLLVVNQIRSNNFTYHVVFGDIKLGDILSEEFSIFSFTNTTNAGSNIMPLRRKNGDVVLESMTYLDEFNSAPTILLLTRGNTGGTRELPLINFNTFSVPSNDLSSQWTETADLNGDGNDDVVINHPFYGNSYVFRADQFGFFSPATTNYLLRRNIGDFNGDGKEDLLSTSDEIISLTLGTESVNLETVVELGLADGLFNVPPTNSTPFNRDYFKGDFNNDGKDDLQFSFSTDSTFGQRIWYGNEAPKQFNSANITYKIDAYGVNRDFRESENLGDINGDGLDDLAILLSRNVEIYLGGNGTSVPDYVISVGEGNTFESIGMDLNGDGFGDLLLSARTIAFDPEIDLINDVFVFYGGQNFDTTADLTISTTQLFGFAVNNGPSFTKIGDVNNDGFEDVLITSSVIGASNVILFGQEDNSEPAILRLPDYNSNFGNPTIAEETSFGFGYHMEGLGDINGDQIDDFAMLDLSRVVDLNNEGRGRGLLMIFYGSTFSLSETAEKFNSPDKLIISDVEAEFTITGIGRKMTVADINGDGENDLIAGLSSVTLNEEATISGISPYYIYFGGTDFDSIPDVKFNVDRSIFFSEDENSALAEFIPVPDLNGDGSDEFLFVPLFGRNAGLYLGGENFVGGKPNAVIESPNQNTSLTYNFNFINRLYTSSIIDADNDGIPEVVLPQIRDVNFRNSPVYFFPLQDPGKETQQITNLTEIIVYTPDPVTLDVSASSGLAVNVEVLSGPATLNEDNTLSFSDTGEVVLEFSQTGDIDFNAAPIVRTTILVTQADQTITFEDIEDTDTGVENISLSATATSGLEVSYEVTEGPATVEGNVLTLTGEPGTVTVQASQVGDSRYLAAESVTISFEVAKVTSTAEGLSDAIRLYPNPAGNTLYLQGLKAGQPTTISIVDLQGKSVLQSVNNEGRLDISILEAGVYLVTIQNAKNRNTYRLVKN